MKIMADRTVVPFTLLSDNEKRNVEIDTLRKSGRIMQNDSYICYTNPCAMKNMLYDNCVFISCDFTKAKDNGCKFINCLFLTCIIPKDSHIYGWECVYMYCREPKEK